MRKADEKKQELRKAVRIRRHMPVRAWIAEWMTTYKEPNVSEKTYQDYKYIIFGPCFICDCSGENFGSLNQDQIKRYTEQFKNPEQILKTYRFMQ